MDGSAGESAETRLRVIFDRRPKLELHGSKITSDAGLLACWKLAGVLGRMALAGAVDQGRQNVITWTRLSCHGFRVNAGRLQLRRLACNPANVLRNLVQPAAVAHRSPTTLREKLVKIGAKVVRHRRSVIFQMAEVAVPRALLAGIVRLFDGLRPTPAPS